MVLVKQNNLNYNEPDIKAPWDEYQDWSNVRWSDEKKPSGKVFDGVSQPSIFLTINPGEYSPIAHYAGEDIYIRQFDRDLYSSSGRLRIVPANPLAVSRSLSQ